MADTTCKKDNCGMSLTLRILETGTAINGKERIVKTILSLTYTVDISLTDGI